MARVVLRPDLWQPVELEPWPGQPARSEPAPRPVAAAPAGWDGSALWAELHAWARTGPAEREGEAWLAAFAARLPCGSCRAHWLALVSNWSPVWGEGLFGWTVEVHNRVNSRLGRREWSREEAAARWPA